MIVIDDVPLTDAIRNLARQSGLNFQFDPRIGATNTPNISIRFENVTPQEALDAVLENHDMQLVMEPNQRIGRITMKDPAALEPLISEILQLKYSDPTNLTAIVKSTLSSRSQVVADPRTSQLIVTTTEREMQAVTNLMKKCREQHLGRVGDGIATPQMSLIYTDMLTAYRRIKDHAFNIAEVLADEK